MQSRRVFCSSSRDLLTVSFILAQFACAVGGGNLQVTLSNAGTAPGGKNGRVNDEITVSEDLSLTNHCFRRIPEHPCFTSVYYHDIVLEEIGIGTSVLIK